MTLPNFLIIGAAKSGTTAVHAYINQHPDIFMSDPKELRFFSYTGLPPKGLPDVYIHQGVTKLEEYQLCFQNVADEKIVGEASPMYLYTPGTAERIKQVIPDVKMLAILRNPIDRAFSAYMHAIRDWIEPAGSFKEALQFEQERINAGWGMLWHYTNAGFYFKQLTRYYLVFNSDQIKVVLYDDLVNDVSALLVDIFAFLEIDTTFKPDITAHPNVSGFPKSQNYHKFLYQLFMKDNPIKRLSRHIVPKSMRQKSMIQLRSMNLEKRAMPLEIRRQLIQLYYDDIKNLEELIHRDLSLWVE
jgi:hypothetical protein